jgi:hypothetical protein
MTSPWVTYQEPPRLSLEGPEDTEWPESKQDEGYDRKRPWRLRKYNPNSNRKGFDDDILANLEHLGVPRPLRVALDSYKELLRFTHTRQTRFKGPPNRDGSNILAAAAAERAGGPTSERNASNDLYQMWTCYAQMLSAIHREGQIKDGPDDTWIYRPWDELATMEQTYPQLLKGIESARLAGPTPDLPAPLETTITPGFEWLLTFRAHMRHLLACFQAIISWAKVTRKNRAAYRDRVSYASLCALLSGATFMLIMPGPERNPATSDASDRLDKQGKQVRKCSQR